jgi:hypothetical protein
MRFSLADSCPPLLLLPLPLPLLPLDLFLDEEEPSPLEEDEEGILFFSVAQRTVPWPESTVTSTLLTFVLVKKFQEVKGRLYRLWLQLPGKVILKSTCLFRESF